MNTNKEISKIIRETPVSSERKPSGINPLSGSQGHDPDEQFVLDIIRSTKQESILDLIEALRLQESKSVLLVRILERYSQHLDNKDLFK
jgi:hypothetical protein